MAAEPSPRYALQLDAAARRAWLIRTLAHLAPDFAGEITGDTPLADGGLGLDSLGLIDVVAALEERLGVTVDRLTSIVDAAGCAPERRGAR